MSILTLPERLRSGVAKVHSLSDPAVNELRTALQTAGLTIHTDDLSEGVALKANSIARADVDQIIETLSGLSSIAASANVPLEEFVDDVLDAMAEAGKNQLVLTGETKEQLKRRLAALLDNPSIIVAAKARLVLIEHEHYLCYARIMTDVRPVFGQNVTEKPTAAMIVHSLKLAYHDGEDINEFFVALDPNSLDRLGQLIERAKVKEETLKSVLGTADVRYLDQE